ncbi:glycosyltransferase [Photorhabdus noenieputensis]|uniref:glycosyltransferase n=1 Tax=Photorhabdus noenieputensis TaxID=1208607 RepID=UPI0035E3E047
MEFLGLKDNNYFNSGILVFNNKPWIEKQLTKRIINFVLNDTREFDFPDQDAINGCLSNEIKCLDDKYDYLVNSNTLNTDKIVFLHFAGDKKPWFP